MPHLSYPNSGRIYANEYSTVNLDCSFTVTPTDVSGITLLTQGIQAFENVYMHTSGSTSAPENPANGLILIQMADNFSKFLNMRASVSAPVTGAAIGISSSSVLTVGAPYSIAAVGTSTAANWVAAGLPLGLTPAVGQTFLAKATGGLTGTGTVKAVGISGISHVEVCGDANLTIAPYNQLSDVEGSWLVLQCLAPTSASVTTLIPTAPATGSIIHLELYMSIYGSSR